MLHNLSPRVLHSALLFPSYDVTFGFACINGRQRSKQCEDYQVILTCPSDFCQGKESFRCKCGPQRCREIIKNYNGNVFSLFDRLQDTLVRLGWPHKAGGLRDPPPGADAISQSGLLPACGRRSHDGVRSPCAPDGWRLPSVSVRTHENVKE